MEILDQNMRVIRTGEGGIGSAAHGIPVGSRSVQPSHFGFGLFSQCLDLDRVGEVGGKDMHAVTEFCSDFLESLFAGTVQADGCTLGMQGLGNGNPDPAGSASDQGFFSCEVKHGLVQF